MWATLAAVTIHKITNTSTLHPNGLAAIALCDSKCWCVRILIKKCHCLHQILIISPNLAIHGVSGMRIEVDTENVQPTVWTDEGGIFWIIMIAYVTYNFVKYYGVPGVVRPQCCGISAESDWSRICKRNKNSWSLFYVKLHFSVNIR